jgi:hypothetical protein
MSQPTRIISKGINWLLPVMYLLLVFIGLTAIFSVEYRPDVNILQAITGLKTNYSRQLLFLVICLVLGILILLTDSKFFYGHRQPLVCIGYTATTGHFCGGQRSKWLTQLDTLGLHEPATCRNL